MLIEKSRLFFCFFSVVILVCTPITHSMIETNDYFFERNLGSKNCNCVIISDSDPYFGILGAVFACQYPKEENDSLLPLMVARNNQLTEKQIIFLKNYTNQPIPLFLGKTDEPDFFDGTSIVGSAPDVSLQLARMMFKTTDAALILPYNSNREYQLSLIASPLASYLNMPLFLVDNNSNEIDTLLISLNVSTLYVVGKSAHNWPVEKQVFLQSIEDIHSLLLDVIKQRFNGLRYLTLTNPSDVIPVHGFNQQKRYINEYISCLSATVFGKTMILQGKNTIINKITVPNGINKLTIQVNITDEKSIFNTIQSVNPILSIKLLDTSNETAAYASSQACSKVSVSTETLICQQPGKYALVTKMYHGFKGGFFSLRGFSQVNAKLNIIEIRRGCGSWECGCGKPHTVPYQINGKSGSVQIRLKPAPRGIGLATGEVAKKILTLSGIKDCWAFTNGQTRTTVNYAKAVFNALKKNTEMRVLSSEVQSTGIISGETEPEEEKESSKTEEAA